MYEIEGRTERSVLGDEARGAGTHTHTLTHTQRERERPRWKECERQGGVDDGTRSEFGWKRVLLYPCRCSRFCCASSMRAVLAEKTVPPPPPLKSVVSLALPAVVPALPVVVPTHPVPMPVLPASAPVAEVPEPTPPTGRTVTAYDDVEAAKGPTAMAT